MTFRPLSHPAPAASAPTARVAESTRRRIGLTGLIVFAFGVLLAPLAHNLGHRADHVHGERHFAFALSALREQIDARAHEHAHEQGHPHVHGSGRSHAHDAPPLPSSDADEPRRSDPHHGEGSLAHFAAAVLAPALFVVPPARTTAERLSPPSLESVCVSRRVQGPIQARAPPA